MAYTIKDGKHYIISANGELIPAEIKKLKSTQILHKTVSGRWVRKLHAIRNNLELTGERKEFESVPTYTVVPERV